MVVTTPAALTLRPSGLEVVVKVTGPWLPEVASWALKPEDPATPTEPLSGAPWVMAEAVTLKVKVQVPVSLSASASVPLTV